LRDVKTNFRRRFGSVAGIDNHAPICGSLTIEYKHERNGAHRRKPARGPKPLIKTGDLDILSYSLLAFRALSSADDHFSGGQL
jgi:hypothetical protein